MMYVLIKEVMYVIGTSENTGWLSKLLSPNRDPCVVYYLHKMKRRVKTSTNQILQGLEWIVQE